MNPEIYTILEDMKNRRPENPIANSDIQTYLQVQNSNLLVLLAEEAEKSAIKTENATKWMVCLTWAIAFLTGVLVLTIFFEFPKITIKPSQNPTFHTEETKTNNSDSKIQTLPKRSKDIPNVSK